MQARLNSIDQDIFQISPTWRRQSTATKGSHQGETHAVQAGYETFWLSYLSCYKVLAQRTSGCR